MIKQSRRSRRRRVIGAATLPLWLAAVSGLLASAGGCGLWHPDRWSFDSLRDERAVEIEQHLSRDEPIVQNPFAKADEKDK